MPTHPDNGKPPLWSSGLRVTQGGPRVGRQGPRLRGPALIAVVHHGRWWPPSGQKREGLRQLPETPQPLKVDPMSNVQQIRSLTYPRRTSASMQDAPVSASDANPTGTLGVRSSFRAGRRVRAASDWRRRSRGTAAASPPGPRWSREWSAASAYAPNHAPAAHRRVAAPRPADPRPRRRGAAAFGPFP